jgi:hypothetical protein
MAELDLVVIGAGKSPILTPLKMRNGTPMLTASARQHH